MNYSPTFVFTPSSVLTLIFTTDKLQSEMQEILKTVKRHFNQDLACLAGAAKRTCRGSTSDSTIINFMKKVSPQHVKCFSEGT